MPGLLFFSGWIAFGQGVAANQVMRRSQPLPVLRECFYGIF